MPKLIDEVEVEEVGKDECGGFIDDSADDEADYVDNLEGVDGSQSESDYPEDAETPDDFAEEPSGAELGDSARLAVPVEELFERITSLAAFSAADARRHVRQLRWVRWALCRPEQPTSAGKISTAHADTAHRRGKLLPRRCVYVQWAWGLGLAGGLVGALGLGDRPARRRRSLRWC